MGRALRQWAAEEAAEAAEAAGESLVVLYGESDEVRDLRAMDRVCVGAACE